MADLTTKYGCGIFNAVFGRRPSRSASTSSLPRADFPKTTSHKSSDSKRRKASFDASFDYSSSTQHSHSKVVNARKVIPPLHVQPQEIQKSAPKGEQHFELYGGNKVPKVSNGISGELEAMIDENQRLNYAGNMNVYANLGNLRQKNTNPGNYHMKTDRKVAQKPAINPTSYCRALSTRMDPEKLKIMGNEDYKNGRFAEALSLYDAAISIDPEMASYRSNKSAALTSLGRLLEAVFEAREAIRIEPFYQRAHNRLATLYLRLGDVDNTIRHYKQAGSEAELDLNTKAQNLQVHLSKCNDAKKRRDWNTLLNETSLAISAGADSALQIYTLKVEGLLKLHRHHEADQVLSKMPKFERDDCTKYYGPIIHANMLIVWARVHLAAGRIDDAMEATQVAGKLDSNNKDVNMMLNKTMVVMVAISKGNDLFNVAKYSEASVAYTEGLDHDPFNSLLFCNRAACRSKLGYFEKAIEDCMRALDIRPSYSKARLRRADCNAKLGKWQASINDYEVLRKEAAEDEQVINGLTHAKEQLQRLGNQHINV